MRKKKSEGLSQILSSSGCPAYGLSKLHLGCRDSLRKWVDGCGHDVWKAVSVEGNIPLELQVTLEECLGELGGALYFHRCIGFTSKQLVTCRASLSSRDSGCRLGCRHDAEG
jgi:hypothetical protein